VRAWLALVALLLAGCAAPDVLATPSLDVAPPPTPDGPCVDVEDAPEAPVHAFYHCAGSELEAPTPVARDTAAANPAGRLHDALIGLVGGPTEAESDAGFVSFFTRDTTHALRSVVVGPDGAAMVDFSDFRAALTNASTSSGSQMLLAQLNATVFQIPEVTSVEYQINGSCPAFWEWLQRGCTRITRTEWGG
jgi:spore germination protein GerM